MDDLLSFVARFVGTAVSGRPFETDRDRVEHHVRRALDAPSTTIVWEDGMKAGVRRVLELLDARRSDPWLSAGPLVDHPSRWEHGDSALTALVRLDRLVLEQGRAANRAAFVTPGRRIPVELSRVWTPEPVTTELLGLIHGSFRALLASHEPRGWKPRRNQLDRRTRELGLAALAGLVTGYRVGRTGHAKQTLVLVPRPLLRVRRVRGTAPWDPDAELHDEDRPAVEWPDGTAVWYWDAVEIPTRIAEGIHTLTAPQIAAIANQEVRRRVLDRTGWERLLADARLVAQDDFGTLWDTRLQLDGERLRVVEVVNATREPDGTYRRYVLRVPPMTRTAREAVAWTFGYDNADEYILAAAS